MSFRDYIKPYLNQRLTAVLLLGFSSGLPLPLIASTLQAWYTVAGVNLMTIGLLSFTQQPYIYKPLWAPLMDRFVPFNLGRRRSWIIAMQFCLALTLVFMAWLNPSTSPWLLAAVALLVAFFSASQDVAIDAYRTDVLTIKERGMGAANTNLGYRCAVIVGGALALVIAAQVGWRATYLLMALIMATEMLVTLWAPRPAQTILPPVSLREAVVEPFHDFLTRRNAIAILIFIIIYKLSDALALSLNTTFLIRSVGFSLVDVGSITKIVGTVSVLLGGIIGGVLMPRLGLYRSLMYFGFLQMSSNLAYALLAMVGKSYLIMTLATFAEYFCSGLSSVATIVFLTSLCNRRFTATQYALFSAVAALGRVFVGPLAAYMVERLGWGEFYVWTFFIGIPALLLLYWLRRRVDFAAALVAG